MCVHAQSQVVYQANKTDGSRCSRQPTSSKHVPCDCAAPLVSEAHNKVAEYTGAKQTPRRVTDHDFWIWFRLNTNSSKLRSYRKKKKRVENVLLLLLLWIQNCLPFSEIPWQEWHAVFSLSKVSTSLLWPSRKWKTNREKYGLVNMSVAQQITSQISWCLWERCWQHGKRCIHWSSAVFYGFNSTTVF